MKHFCLVFGFLLVSTLGFSQGFSAKVVSAKTGEPIAYATVITGKHSGLITNEEGVFSLSERAVSRMKDSLYVSFMGFEKKGIWLPDFKGGTIALNPKTFELDKVFVDASGLSAKEIVEKVKENVATNYSMGLSAKQFFFRRSDFNLMDKSDFRFKKSTIPELNEELIDSLTGMIPKKSSYYTEAAGTFYGDYHTHKIKLDKAAELYDKNKDVSVDGMADRLERIFQENVKRDSYIKLRSGIFSTKVQLDSVAEANPEEAENIKAAAAMKEVYPFHKRVRNRISELYSQLFFNDDTELDFLEKSNRYRFTLTDYTFIGDDPVFIVNFEPKGKKDFKGVMYVNTTDFAILRLEFENVRPLRNFRLLGLTYRRSVYRGKMLFGKEPGGGYGPKFIELEDGSLMGVDRPLNVIEKNKNVKGRRKQNELALHIDVQVTSLQKYELVVFNSEALSAASYEQLEESGKVTPTYLSRYDPEFWKGYTIMEPNAAIQAFEVVE